MSCTWHAQKLQYKKNVIISLGKNECVFNDLYFIETLKKIRISIMFHVILRFDKIDYSLSCPISALKFSKADKTAFHPGILKSRTICSSLLKLNSLAPQKSSWKGLQGTTLISYLFIFIFYYCIWSAKIWSISKLCFLKLLHTINKIER